MKFGILGVYILTPDRWDICMVLSYKKIFTGDAADCKVNAVKLLKIYNLARQKCCASMLYSYSQC